MSNSKLYKGEMEMSNLRVVKTLNAAAELLEPNVALRSDKVAIFCGEERVTYKALQENVNKFANVLKALGVMPTERVMIVLPDNPDFMYAFLGSIKFGAWAKQYNNLSEIK